MNLIDKIMEITIRCNLPSPTRVFYCIAYGHFCGRGFKTIPEIVRETGLNILQVRRSLLVLKHRHGIIEPTQPKSGQFRLSERALNG